ncbi:MAG: acylglycerol kinase family protein, partial [Bacteroidaceae bacterium]|nr:acylglycerol kinase family protein [Bacteroidaceae bacterium]
MAEKKTIQFIVNPISGTSGKRFVIKLIEEYLDKSRYNDYTIVQTRWVGHATELAKEAARQGVDVVCAIGGDGTVNEVAGGLVHTQTALAIIPSGSGNGLARHLRIPTDPLSAIKIINRGLVHTMDYGVVNGRPFFCTCGVGFDAFISQRFAESGKRGPVAY